LWRQGQSKKLKEAARLLARGELTTGPHDDDAPPSSDTPTEDDEAAQALAAFGLVAVEGSGAGRAGGQPVFHLWPEHEAAFTVFIACRTQWRLAPMGGALGLDYAGVEALIRMRRLVPRQQLPEVMADIQVLEASTVAEWQAERERKERSSSGTRRA
jgi:hypothetical protein